MSPVSSPARSAPPLLEVRDLVIEFQTDHGSIRAVDGLNFEIASGDTLGLVGESGCGKSVTALALLGLIPAPTGRIVRGSIRLNGLELVGLPERELRRLRGRDIAIIFQEPMTALNPVMSIAGQMIRVLRQHKSLSHRQARAAAIEMLALTGISSPERRIDDFPHELSGGMRQRVLIAMAMSCGPQLLVADEPTTALDVSIQAQVLEQLSVVQSRFGTAILLISHDLAVIAQTCRRALVMYCGQAVEEADTEALFESPAHPYTAGLLASNPALAQSGKRLPVIAGNVPESGAIPIGCRFAPRCPRARARCHQDAPLRTVKDGRQHACFFPLEKSDLPLTRVSHD
jgi:oligopeptide/dipeptide ABC transporter ATP-binding protein